MFITPPTINLHYSIHYLQFGSYPLVVPNTFVVTQWPLVLVVRCTPAMHPITVWKKPVIAPYTAPAAAATLYAQMSWPSLWAIRAKT